ncbi:MAG: hypothetical protein L0Y37_00015 [Bacteroidales bacterium]|nr:hypothetical protein [Bacteroidales bacterium]
MSKLKFHFYSEALKIILCSIIIQGSSFAHRIRQLAEKVGFMGHGAWCRAQAEVKVKVKVEVEVEVEVKVKVKR